MRKQFMILCLSACLLSQLAFSSEQDLPTPLNLASVIQGKSFQEVFDLFSKYDLNLHESTPQQTQEKIHINGTNHEGLNSLQIIVRDSDGCSMEGIYIMTALLRLEAQVDLAEKGTENALFLATRKNCIALARFLLSHGAQVDISSEEGLTPVTLAIQNNNEELALLLVSFKASLEAQYRGKKARQWAREMKMIKLLRTQIPLFKVA